MVSIWLLSKDRRRPTTSLMRGPQRLPYVEATRRSYEDFWLANVRASEPMA